MAKEEGCFFYFNTEEHLLTFFFILFCRNALFGTSLEVNGQGEEGVFYFNIEERLLTFFLFFCFLLYLLFFSLFFNVFFLFFIRLFSFILSQYKIVIHLGRFYKSNEKLQATHSLIYKPSTLLILATFFTSSSLLLRMWSLVSSFLRDFFSFPSFPFSTSSSSSSSSEEVVVAP